MDVGVYDESLYLLYAAAAAAEPERERQKDSETKLCVHRGGGLVRKEMQPKRGPPSCGRVVRIVWRQ